MKLSKFHCDCDFMSCHHANKCGDYFSFDLINKVHKDMKLSNFHWVVYRLLLGLSYTKILCIC